MAPRDEATRREVERTDAGTTQDRTQVGHMEEVRFGGGLRFIHRAAAPDHHCVAELAIGSLKKERVSGSRHRAAMNA